MDVNLEFVVLTESGPDIADEDGGAELDGDTVGIIAEPEGSIFFEFFVRFKFEGGNFDFLQAHVQADGRAAVVHLVGEHGDAQEMGSFKGTNHERDFFTNVKSLAANVEHRRKDVEDGGEFENLINPGGFLGCGEDGDFTDLDAVRPVADGGGNTLFLIAFGGVKITRPQGGGGEFGPEIALIREKTGGGAEAPATGADHVVSGLPGIRRGKLHFQTAGIDQAFPTDLELQCTRRNRGMRPEIGRSEIALPGGLGESGGMGEKQSADDGFPTHACSDFYLVALIHRGIKTGLRHSSYKIGEMRNFSA